MEEKLGWQIFQAELVLLVKLKFFGEEYGKFLISSQRHETYARYQQDSACQDVSKACLLCLLLGFPDQCLRSQDILPAKQVEASVKLIASKH